ncbi:FkbM family methyltransferase [Kaistella faecalis]|uniref:FkbM family methyltransferase n=1 Tax=Kaistella faecalis TaxID=2852098 RepID=UPI001C46EDF1|nr:FkbM family methyltransferase [Chryseobacterium faecale]UFK97417.1 FkbM family methyltransferase [Chryseobacterium faecale]
MSLYQRLTEKLQFFTPGFYKARYFKHLKNISRENYSARNIEPELIWIKDFLKKDAVMIDIGANVGSFIYQMEQKLSPQNIYAFEPNKKIYNRLKRIFPQVHIYPLALSDRNETAEFKIPVIKGKTYTSRGTLKLDYRENEESKHILQQVKVIKLDDWAGLENLKKIDFIKIDVEGNEMNTLRGAKKVIEEYRPTLMVEMEQRHHSEPLPDLIHEIENWGYGAFFFNRTTFELEKLTENIITGTAGNRVGSKAAYINNIIFIPQPLKNTDI